MLNRLHRARIPLHQLVQPPPTPTPNPCYLCSIKGKQREHVPPPPRPGTRTSRTTRQIDWSQPSTSAVPYSSPPSSSSPRHARSHSTSVRTSCPPRPLDAPVTPFATAVVDSGNGDLVTLVRSISRTRSRAQFNLEFDRLSTSLASLSRVDSDAAHAAAATSPAKLLREVKRVVERVNGWKLDERQLRVVLVANVEREMDKRIKQMHLEANQLARRSSSRSSTTRERSSELGSERVEEEEEEGDDTVAKAEQVKAERAVWAQRQRQNVSDRLLSEYFELVSDPNAVPRSHHAEVEHALQRFAHAAAIRPVSSTRDHDGRAVAAYSLALDYVARTPTKPDEPTTPHVVEDDIGEVVRRMFKQGRDEEATAILTKMTQKGRVLTVRVMRDIVRDHYGATPAATIESPSDRADRRNDDADANDEYSHARRVLDQVCASTSLAGLDELLRLRLERVDRLEELEKNPHGAFLKWMSVKGAGRPDWIETALRMWELGVRRKDGQDGREGGGVVGRASRKALERLVLEACRVGGTTTTSADPRASRTERSRLVDYAVRLAIEHWPLQVLTHHSHVLLTALTVGSHSPDLASRVFDLVNSPPLDFAFGRFQWSAQLVTPFTRLFFSSQRYERDPSLPIRLYLSWTASGLTFPTGLWDPLWRSLGRTGTTDDLERVLQDWDDTGRNRAESRIVRQVLQGATSSGNVPRSFELFEFFRSRYAPPPRLDDPPPRRSPTRKSTLPPPPPPREPLRPAFEKRRRRHLDPLVVPLDSYNSLLDLVARSRDRNYRTRLSKLFKCLVEDGHAPSTETYNAFLAANLVRPPPLAPPRRRRGRETVVKPEPGVERARSVYDAMIRDGLAPDRDTYGLLIQGFNRLARTGLGLLAARLRRRRDLDRRAAGSTQRRGGEEEDGREQIEDDEGNDDDDDVRLRVVRATEASLRTFKASLEPTMTMTTTTATTANTDYLLGDNNDDDDLDRRGGRDGGSPVSGTRIGSTTTTTTTLAKGEAVGELMIILAQLSRFEDAKQVGEAWWRTVVIQFDDNKLELARARKEPSCSSDGKDFEAECDAMRRAGIKVEELERASVARRD